MKALVWLSILAAAASYNLGLGLPIEKEEPVIPELPPVVETEPVPEEIPEELPAPTAAQLYTEFYKTYFASVDAETDWDNATYFIALPDLDFNGIPELIVEKAGASAANYIEIYTIEDGEVRAFTESRLNLPYAKNAVDFGIEGDLASSFNIHEDGDGYAMYAESRNGASDMQRSTWYKFTSVDGALACETITSYHAEMTDWNDYRLDIAVWDGVEYAYDEFEPLYREWLTDYFQAHPITDASYMDPLRTHEINNADAAYALIAEICG